MLLIFFMRFSNITMSIHPRVIR